MIVDIIIGVALITSIAIGIKRGFVKELSVIVGLILGFYIASQKSILLEKYIFKSSPPSTSHHIICFLIILVIVFFLVFLLGLLLQKLVQLIMLGWLDKILGGVFGIVKGAIIVWLILLLIITVFPNTQNSLSKSFLATKIMELGSKITKLQIKVSKPTKLLTQSRNLSIFNISHQPIGASGMTKK
jgi:membrane protein required for colicin V production